MRSSHLLAIGLAVACSAVADQRAVLDTKAPAWLKEHDVPSVAVAYIKNGKLAWTRVYGNQSPGTKATENTIYNVASLTKPVVAEVVLRLASEGKLNLDEPMKTHWVDPDVVSNSWNELLTPRIALKHETGFTNWRYQTKNVLEFQWRPGTNFGYSGEGYNYVARFVEKKMQLPFEELATRYVLDPVGMKDTAFTHREWHKGRIAEPYGAATKTKIGAPDNWNAADLLHTTIGDYSKFVVSVMRDEKLSRAVAEQRLKPTRNIAPAEDVAKICAMAKLTNCVGTAGMGLGWEVLNFNGETIVRHGGSDPGVRTVALFVPSKNIGVIVFTNGHNGSKVIREVVGLLYPNPMLVQIL